MAFWILEALVLLLILPARSLLFVGEGDTYFELYVNGFYVLQDGSVPVVPLNDVRQTSADTATARVMSSTHRIGAGDLIAVRAYSLNADFINVTNALGKDKLYPAFAGIILAGEDGTMSSDEFKCSTQSESDDLQKIPFYSPVFNDTLWDYAYEQPEDCCPWRDPDNAWNHLNAKWIGLHPSTFGGNISGPRTFYCRYEVPGNTTSTRLPQPEVEKESPVAPLVNITEVRLATSMSLVSFTVPTSANVFCGMIDARYTLRPPTHLELKNWGDGLLNAEGPVTGYRDIDAEWGFREIDYPPLDVIEAEELEECEAACTENGGCAAIVFFAVGADFSTGLKCKLLNSSYDPSVRKPASTTSLLQQREQYLKPNVQTITISGMLLPGTIYSTFCSSEDPATGNHSNITAIEETLFTDRTQGCFDCGSTDPPQVTVLGGWAGVDSIGIVAQSSRAGRIFCSATEIQFMNESVTLTAASIRAPNYFNILTVGGAAVGVNIFNVQPHTLYEVACVAEADGGLESEPDQIDNTRRKMLTATKKVTINSMKLVREPMPADPENYDQMTVYVQMTALGYLWCNVFPTESIMNVGVPNATYLREIGLKQKVVDIQQDAPSLYDLLSNVWPYDVWCTAEENDFSNESTGDAVLSPYPIVTVNRIAVSYDSIIVTANVNKGPANVYCDVFQWALRPTTVRPQPPTQDDMAAKAKYKTEIYLILGGAVEIEIPRLTPGMYYDLYCYSEEKQPPTPPGVAPPPRKGMTTDAIFFTRQEVLMKGPLFDELGWSCVSGHSCGIDHVLGVGLTKYDRIMVRSDECPGRCMCNGKQDGYRKGNECSAISQDVVVVSGVGITDRKDPRGEWCYVDAGTCADEEPSKLFPSMMLSYKVCTYNATVGARSEKGPPGFPNGGVATTFPDGEGRNFTWGEEPLVAAGMAYSICWCNGTESSCQLESDFRLRLGALHFGGPTAEQAKTNLTCRVGMPCTLSLFDGYALKEGSRLAVLPKDPRGCFWEKSAPFDPPGVDGFPNWGVSEPFNETTREYHWFGTPVIVPGGIYNLCWCGPPRQGMVKAPGKEYRMPDGITPEPCPSDRPEDAGRFTAPAGELVVIGPVPQEVSYCKLGVECKLPDVQGTGLQGSDRLSVLETCGEPARPPAGWDAGVEDLGAAQWSDAGWMTHGPSLSREMLFTFGTPEVPGEEPFRLEDMTTNYNQITNVSDRGVYGFPNFGMTAPHPTPGFFSWGGPSWAYAGTYILCWCGADATTEGCKSPADFLAPVGLLVITGPAVLPRAAQIHRCVRGRRCEINYFFGTNPAASKLMVASGECGSESPYGVPQKGMSLPSPDGFIYRWGEEPLMANPDEYRLCWCSSISSCNTYDRFLSYGGRLQVKAPTVSPYYFYCMMGSPCNVTGISGVGLHDGDKVMPLAACGDGGTPDSGFGSGGGSIATYEGGTVFTLPDTTQAGTYQLCWCAAEQSCMNGWDYTLSLGRLDIGGPKPGFTYLCFEWEPCFIPEIEGLEQSLSDGDLFLVIANGIKCKDYPEGEPTPPFQDGFPNDGVSLPATGGGKNISWGDGLIRAPPGVYSMCWCSNQTQPGGCTKNGPFNIPGGTIRIGNSKEFQYVTRPEDPEPRDGDQQLSYLIAIPLPLLFCGAVVLGVRKLQSTKAKADPEAPPIRIFDPPKALTKAQNKDKHNTEVKEVLETRTRVAGYVEWKASQENAVKDTVLALYGLARHHTVVEQMKQEKRKHHGTLEEYQSANADAIVEESESEPDEEMGGLPRNDSRPSSGSGERNDKEKAEENINVPDPPKPTFNAKSNRKLMELMDIKDFSDGDGSDAGSHFGRR
mmetsp:Transcript_56124/g.99929  ORF Transcript_56124/g.99929 Transcript_56124/m.99929 type:complete len:1827 (-) Transcript_56124:189-5669(-)|eukprot:CAMPEP_0197630540 /NCGR_PEP_ID=MMETSP1338-20131121/7988_1 /TAXON_ID=43686 ORGANISM="Pelagodinium beii, Strain RCC1491" /NCGR_SAMPLE_ID=MMETSP1338 /ASSEMBLY_ACC=CAM_ASM_000754 /LENGTH=1826 /DNA_ID=CAMNT_0043201775 /DNA_START=89 /DNA_END=5569 /DNA_ORIENTATION=+